MIWWPQMGIHIQNNIKREFWIPNCKLQLNLGRYYLFSMIYIAMSKIPEAITWSSSPLISSHLGLLLCCADGTVRADTMSWTGEETEAKDKLLTNFFFDLLGCLHSGLAPQPHLLHSKQLSWLVGEDKPWGQGVWCQSSAYQAVPWGCC